MSVDIILSGEIPTDFNNSNLALLAEAKINNYLCR